MVWPAGFARFLLPVFPENSGQPHDRFENRPVIKLRLVEMVIQGRDFTAMAETINAADAWLSSLPGHVYANVRQPPISTLICRPGPSFRPRSSPASAPICPARSPLRSPRPSMTDRPAASC
ncbi:MAG: Conjugal transfer protein [Tardiphaga sp.]|nr:Conjugal transfer protein [Tardiphaga sp.]